MEKTNVAVSFLIKNTHFFKNLGPERIGHRPLNKNAGGRWSP